MGSLGSHAERMCMITDVITRIDPENLIRIMPAEGK
jgi:hypothetical protein